VTPDADGLVEAPDAALGRGDPTRRWAIAHETGLGAFPGITRPEGRAALDVLVPGGQWGHCLVAVSLPVLLSDGAGPYLVDAGGALVLAVAEHPRLSGLRVGIGPLEDGIEQIGVVERAGPPSDAVWCWRAVARVGAATRLAALDALDEVSEITALPDWARDVEASG